MCLQLLIARNSAVRTPRRKIGEVCHQCRWAVGRFHEDGSFVRIGEKHIINRVVQTVALLNQLEDPSFCRG